MFQCSEVGCDGGRKRGETHVGGVAVERNWGGLAMCGGDLIGRRDGTGGQGYIRRARLTLLRS